MQKIEQWRIPIKLKEDLTVRVWFYKDRNVTPKLFMIQQAFTVFAMGFEVEVI